MNLPRSKCKGVTTTELLIAIGILGLLSAAVFKFLSMQNSQSKSAERTQEAFAKVIFAIETMRAEIKHAHTLTFSTAPTPSITATYDSLSGTVVSQKTVVWKMDVCSSTPCLTRTVSGGATLTFPIVSALNWCLGSVIIDPSCPSYFLTLVPSTTTPTQKLLLAEFALSGTFETNGSISTKTIPFAIDIDSHKSDGSTMRSDVRVIKDL